MGKGLGRGRVEGVGGGRVRGGRGWWWVDWGYGERGGRDGEGFKVSHLIKSRVVGKGKGSGRGGRGRGWWWEVRGGRQGQVERWSGMVGKGKGEEVAVRAGRVFTDAAPLLLGSADMYTVYGECFLQSWPFAMQEVSTTRTILVVQYLIEQISKNALKAH